MEELKRQVAKENEQLEKRKKAIDVDLSEIEPLIQVCEGPLLALLCFCRFFGVEISCCVFLTFSICYCCCYCYYDCTRSDSLQIGSKN